jgi:DNA-binding PadR family transcriptional regulator
MTININKQHLPYQAELESLLEQGIVEITHRNSDGEAVYALTAKGRLLHEKTKAMATLNFDGLEVCRKLKQRM